MFYHDLADYLLGDGCGQINVYILGNKQCFQKLCYEYRSVVSVQVAKQSVEAEEFLSGKNKLTFYRGCALG